MNGSHLQDSRDNVVSALANANMHGCRLDAAEFDLAVAAIQAQQALAEATRAQTLVLERMERNGQTRTVGL
jgi:hypothetical protein